MGNLSGVEKQRKLYLFLRIQRAKKLLSGTGPRKVEKFIADAVIRKVKPGTNRGRCSSKKGGLKNVIENSVNRMKL